ncbi:hypothetical protein [Streptomyces sp. NPDC001089]
MTYLVEDKHTGKLRKFLDLGTAVVFGTTWIFVVEDGKGRLIDMPMIGGAM